MNAPTVTTGAPSALTIEDVIARGDLRQLTPEQRVVYYHNVCRSLGLNPATQPFQYLTLNGKLVLYARRDAADQLRKINGITINIVSVLVQDGLVTVHVRATDKTGRADEDYGVVPCAGRGETAANAFLKAVTKAKRRVTLSISGLGFMDESELPAFQPEPRTHPSIPQAERTRFVEEEHQERELADNRFYREPEAEPHEVPRAEGDGWTDAAAWSDWSKRFYAFIKASSSADKINDWITANSEPLAELQQHDAGKYRTLVDMVTHQTAARAELEA